jgi:hypothetical protein
MDDPGTASWHKYLNVITFLFAVNNTISTKVLLLKKEFTFLKSFVETGTVGNKVEIRS